MDLHPDHRLSHQQCVSPFSVISFLQRDASTSHLPSAHAIDLSHSGTERDGFYFMTGSIAGTDQILARIRYGIIGLRMHIDYVC